MKDKKILKVTAIAMTALLTLQSCSSSVKSSNSLSTEDTETKEVVTSHRVAPKTSEESTQESPPPTMMQAPKIENSDQETLDKWFFAQMHEVKIPDSDQSLRGLRRDTCNLLQSKQPIEDVASAIMARGYDEKQTGTIIGASMVSLCNTSSAVVGLEYLPENQSIGDEAVLQHQDNQESQSQ